MIDARQEFPVEKIACACFAGLAALLLFRAWSHPPPSPPTDEELVPRIKMGEAVRRLRPLPTEPVVETGHLADPFAPDVLAFRRPQTLLRPVPAAAASRPGPERQASLPVVQLPALPRPKAAATAESRPGAATADAESPEEMKLPGPVVGIFKRPDGLYAAIVQNDKWTVMDGGGKSWKRATVPLLAGDEWAYDGEHFRIVDITADSLIVRNREGLMKPFRVGDGESPPRDGQPPEKDAETWRQLMDKLLDAAP